MSLSFFLESFLKQPLDFPYFSQPVATLFFHLYLLVTAYQIQVNSKSIGNVKESQDKMEELLLKANKSIAKLLNVDSFVDNIKKRKVLTTILTQIYEDMTQFLKETLYIFHSQFLSSLLSSSREAIYYSRDSSLITNFLLILKDYIKKNDCSSLELEPQAIDDSLSSLLKEAISLKKQGYSSIVLPIYNFDSLDINTISSIERAIPTAGIDPNKKFEEDDDNGEEEEVSSILSTDNIDLSEGFAPTFRGIWDGKLVAIKKIDPRHLSQGVNGIYDIASYAQKSSELSQKCPFLYGYTGISIHDNKSKVKIDGNFPFFTKRDLKKLNKLKKSSLNEYYNIIQNDPIVFLISPLAPSLSLHDAFLNSSTPSANRVKLTPSHKISILLDVCLGLEFLHKNNIIHGRLTDKNIMLFDNMRVKISDFGLYEHFDIEARVRRRGNYGVRYTAPELIQFEEKYLYNLIENKEEKSVGLSLHKKSALFCTLISPQPQTSISCILSTSFLLSSAIDIYSFGVLVLVLLTEKIPFPNLTWPQAVRNQLLKGTLPVMTSNYNDHDLIKPLEDEIVRSCVKNEFFARPNITELTKSIKNILVKINSNEKKMRLAKLKDDLNDIQSDIDDIRNRTEYHIELIEQEKKNISKLEDEKLRSLDANLKRKIDSNLFNLRKKISEYNDEIQLLTEDEENAENDLEIFQVKINALESEISKSSEEFFIKEHLENSPLHSNTDLSFASQLYFNQKDIGDFEKRNGNIILSSPFPFIIDKSIPISKSTNSDDYFIFPFPIPSSVNIYDELVLKGGYKGKDLMFLLPLLKIQQKCNLIDYEGQIEELFQEGIKDAVNPILNKILSGNPYQYIFDMLNKLVHLLKFPLISSIRDKIKKKTEKVREQINKMDSDDEENDNENSKSDSNILFAEQNSDDEDYDENQIIEERNINRGTVIDSDDEESIDNQYVEYQENFKIKNRDDDDDDDDEGDVNYGMSESSRSFNYSTLFRNPSNILTTKFNFFSTTTSQSQLLFNYLKSTLINITKCRFSVSSPSLKDSPVQFLNKFVNSPTQVQSAFVNFSLNEVERVRLLYSLSVRGNWRESTGLNVKEIFMSDEELANLIEANISPIHLACMHGNVLAVHDLIRIQFSSFYTERKTNGIHFKFPSVICTDLNGDSPLHYACKRGHIEIVKILVETYNQSPVCSNNSLISPLIYAVKYGHLECLKYFLENSSCCNLNISDEDKLEYEKNPIVINGNTLGVPFISSHYRDYKFGATLLHWACLSRSVSMLEYLITDHSMPVSCIAYSDITSPLHWACFGGSNNLVKYLIERAGADTLAISKHGSSCLHFATASGEVEKVAYLIDVVKLKVTLKDKNQQSAFDTATGNVIFFFKERKKKGFVTESITEKKN